MNAGKHDWANLNTLRAYPLEYDTPPISSTGFELPHSLLADCLVVFQADAVAPVLTGVHFSATTVSVSFADSLTGKEIFVAQSSASDDYSVSKVLDVSDYGITGWVTFGEVKSLESMAKSGMHSFEYGRPALSPHCYMCAGAPPISSVSANLGKIRGDLKLGLGGSMAASVSTSAPSTTNGVPEHTIELFLTDTKSFMDVCAPAESVCDCPQIPIGRINTVYPDANGNIGLVIADGLAEVLGIETVGGTILISARGSSTATCPPQNIPFADGRLPSESMEAS